MKLTFLAREGWNQFCLIILELLLLIMIEFGKNFRISAPLEHTKVIWRSEINSPYFSLFSQLIEGLLKEMDESEKEEANNLIVTKKKNSRCFRRFLFEDKTMHFWTFFVRCAFWARLSKKYAQTSLSAIYTDICWGSN